MPCAMVPCNRDVPKRVTVCSPLVDSLHTYFLFIHDTASQSKTKHKKNQLGFPPSSSKHMYDVLSTPAQCAQTPIAEKWGSILNVHQKGVVNQNMSLPGPNLFRFIMYYLIINIPSSIINYGFISKKPLVILA